MQRYRIENTFQIFFIFHRRPHHRRVDPAWCDAIHADPAARHLVMLPQMWGGDDIFLLATTLWIVVTDRVRDLLVRVPASNLQYHRLEGAA